MARHIAYAELKTVTGLNPTENRIAVFGVRVQFNM